MPAPTISTSKCSVCWATRAAGIIESGIGFRPFLQIPGNLAYSERDYSGAWRAPTVAIAEPAWKIRPMNPRSGLPHSSHWGAFSVLVKEQELEILPHPRDLAPSVLLGNIPAAVSHRARIARPMIRRGWLERGPGADERRGCDEFVAISWDEAFERLAGELRRVYDRHGPRAVFGGSYGWASAGRFHDAQHQLHRFLNLSGGYVRSVNSYSSGAASVILPHIIGPQAAIAGNNVSWAEMVAESALVLAFGGMALKNGDVGGGGTSQHIARDSLTAARRRGVEFHLIGPIRDDLPDTVDAVWHPIRPGTDVALMLGLAHTLVAEGMHDRAFLDRYCTRWEKFAAYLLGRDDGQPKDAAWAAAICGISADDIVALARCCAGRRTLVTCSQSLQRADHGEQPVWMAVVLAAMLGQIGLPGGGFAYALGSTSNTGKPPLAVPLPTLPTGRNSVADFIPVARIADMLLHPGEAFDYNGQQLTYPDIRLVYWAGGNPFHHHQNLGRLHRAFAPFAAIPKAHPYRRQAARSRSPPRRSPASAMTIARNTRHGCRRSRGPDRPR